MKVPEEVLPDVRDGLTREERVVLYVLHETQKERGGRDVPTAMLWGRVCEHFYISPEDLSEMLARLGARKSSTNSTLARLFAEALRLHVPGRQRAQRAVVADEHLRGVGVLLELPPQPVRRDVRVFAAAGMEHGGRVAGVRARAVERRHVRDRLVRRVRRGRQEVALGAVDQQHGSVQILDRVGRRESACGRVRVRRLARRS